MAAPVIRKQEPQRAPERTRLQQECGWKQGVRRGRRINGQDAELDRASRWSAITVIGVTIRKDIPLKGVTGALPVPPVGRPSDLAVPRPTMRIVLDTARPSHGSRVCPVMRKRGRKPRLPAIPFAARSFGLHLTLALKIERHGGADKILQCRLVDLVAFVDVDSAPDIAVEAGVKQT
jgi:hypothetical protein